MKVQILFDSESVNPDFKTGWGFSILIGEKILFDTGENGDWLIDNMNLSGVEIGKIEKVVLSHEHLDHTGGLVAVLRANPGIRYFTCSGFSEDWKTKIRLVSNNMYELDNLKEVESDVFVTGPFLGSYKSQDIYEQAIIIKSENGVSLITGCAHPGIISILRYVKEIFPTENLFAVLGGFHSRDFSENEIKKMVEAFKAMGVKKAGPTHCSGETAIRMFKEAFKEGFIPVFSGDSLFL